jgi:hypothetical protein
MNVSVPDRLSGCTHVRLVVRNMNVNVPDSLSGCTHVASPEQLSFYAEWSSLTNVFGRISICPYHYLELKSVLIVYLRETNCYIRLNKRMFKSATWRELFVCVGKRTDTRKVSHVSVLMYSCV